MLYCAIRYTPTRDGIQYLHTARGGSRYWGPVTDVSWYTSDEIAMLHVDNNADATILAYPLDIRDTTQVESAAALALGYLPIPAPTPTYVDTHDCTAVLTTWMTETLRTLHTQWTAELDLADRQSWHYHQIQWMRSRVGHLRRLWTDCDIRSRTPVLTPTHLAPGRYQVTIEYDSSERRYVVAIDSLPTPHTSPSYLDYTDEPPVHHIDTLGSVCLMRQQIQLTPYGRLERPDQVVSSADIERCCVIHIYDSMLIVRVLQPDIPST